MNCILFPLCLPMRHRSQIICKIQSFHLFVPRCSALHDHLKGPRTFDIRHGDDAQASWAVNCPKERQQAQINYQGSSKRGSVFIVIVVIIYPHHVLNLFLLVANQPLSFFYPFSPTLLHYVCSLRRKCVFLFFFFSSISFLLLL